MYPYVSILTMSHPRHVFPRPLSKVVNALITGADSFCLPAIYPSSSKVVKVYVEMPIRLTSVFSRRQLLLPLLFNCNLPESGIHSDVVEMAIAVVVASGVVSHHYP